MLLEKNSSKRASLAWYDILILTAIFWSVGIVSSTHAYIELIRGTATIDENLVFSAADNYIMLTQQGVCLAGAGIYLWFRRFDFKSWNIRFSPKAVGLGCLVFLGGAVMMDAYSLIVWPLEEIAPFPHIIGAFFGNELVSTVIYAVFNGVYEEIYFLGICLAVKPEHRKWAVPFSLLVRVSFHTYQGMFSALGIGVLFGLYFYLLYHRSKDKNLVPFFIAHMWGDIIGVGILHYLVG